MKHLVQVKRSPIHGRGLFARRHIPAGTHIGNYEGPETLRDGAYVLWCVDENDRPFGIDGKNMLRFTNHSSEPNAIFFGDELHTLRDVEEGEEITFHYGEEWD